MRLELERRVRAFVCDVDGCLVAVGHLAYDLEALTEVVRLNRASEHDPNVPVLTLLTGRPHPYVDALMQVLDVRVAASFENGAGLATRHPYRAWLAEGARERLDELRRLAELVEARPHLMLQLGKVASMTVFPREATRDVGWLVDELDALLVEHGIELVLDPSNDCVNVLVPGIDKASGFSLLCRELGVGEGEVAGIGDSVGDVAWLRRCAVGVVPANAAPEVRAGAAVASERRDAAAVLQTYRALVAANRRV